MRFPHTNILSAWPRGDLIHSNYFIDSFPGPYHCSFPSIKHMPGWIMWRDTTGGLLRQTTTRLHPCGVCFYHVYLLFPPYLSSHTLSPLLFCTSSLNTNYICYTIPLFSFAFFYVSRHACPASLQVWAQEPHCSDGSHSCVKVRGAAGLGDRAVGERWPPPGTSDRSARLSTLQHDWKPQER